MPPCSVAGGYQLSEEHNAYLLYITEMEVIFSPETLVTHYQTTKCHDLKYYNTKQKAFGPIFESGICWIQTINANN
jgi:hypothetical protein